MGQGSLVRGQGSLDSRPRVRDQGHKSGVSVKDHRSQIRGQESWVKSQWSIFVVRCHLSEVTGQRPLVIDQGSLVKGHWSVVNRDFFLCVCVFFLGSRLPYTYTELHHAT